MGSLIEAAAKRLELLRRAGVATPTELAQPSTEQPSTIVRARGVTPLQRPVQHANQSAHVTPIETGAPGLEVDLHALDARGFVTSSGKRSIVHDQFRVIKRQLIRNATGQGGASITHGNLIMITSAMAGEGKTFSAINLAMSIALERDHTVLLVDADVARPSVVRTLVPAMASSADGEPPRGLLDLLDGQCNLGDVLVRTNVEKLSILPSGAYRPNATELLASDAMRQLLDQIASRYPDRIVIFDSPPLLLTTEAQVLATQMGQVVMVVSAGKTPQGAVKNALTTIENCHNKMLLLNRAEVSTGEGYTGYGYGYAYGYGREGARAP